MTGNKPRLGSAFSIGGDQAEADPLLEAAFYNSGLFNSVANHDDPRCFLVGRTGSGKSALLNHLAEVWPEKVVRVVPEDLSMPYITDLDVVERLTKLGVDLAPFWKALWRHVLIVEVIRHRYKIDSPDAKSTVLQTLRDKVARNQAKREALAYLDEFGGKFWAETDERVKEITRSLTKKFEASADGSLKLVGSGGGGSLGRVSELTESERTELVHRYQRIVNETQLARLNKMMQVLEEDVLKSSQDYTYIIIDDLDKDWVDTTVRNDLILALLRTVHDLKRVRNLKVVVALRTNILRHLDFGASNAGQEEKFRSLVLDITWDRPSLTALLDERVKVAARRQKSVVSTAVSILPHSNPKRGAAIDYMLDRTMLRPRDLIAFMKECVSKSEGKAQVSWDAIHKAEVPYSDNRLLALRDEWKLNYPGIGSVFEQFRGAPGRMDRGTVERILDECVLLVADPQFVGVTWMTAASNELLSGGPQSSWTTNYMPLIRVLFDIGFLGVSGRSVNRPTFVTDDEMALRTPKSVEQAEYFFVSRMFHQALDVRLGPDVQS